MAVIQISKIQVRRGAIGDQGMPQLASGEMGWAVDTQQLFIGNGSVAEGAPAVGNTEILTQYSTATINLFNCIYEYKGDAFNNQPNGAAYFQPDVVDRPLQSKLDETVSVLDFGAVGDGITDNVSAFRRAIRSLYLNANDSGQDTSFRKILHFPAGTYIVSTATLIPPNAHLQGEGSSSTVIVSINTGGTNAIFRTRSVTNSGTFLTTVGNPLSLPVSNVTIQDMGFKYSDNVPIYTTGTNATNPSGLLNLDMAVNSKVKNCQFIGTFTNLFPLTSSIQNAGQNPVRYAGINITGSLTSDLEIDNNLFTGLIMGVYAYQDNKYITYSNNVFDTLYSGLILGSTIVSSLNYQGGLFNKAINNKFINTNNPGIVLNIPAGATTATGFVSDSNLFVNVGNGTVGNEGAQAYACIAFNNATGCVSVNDRFTRFNLAQTTYSTSTFKPLVTGQAIVINDHTAYRYPIKWTSDSTLIRIPYQNTMTGVVMEYQVEKSATLGGVVTGVRKGTFTVNASSILGGTPSITYTDQYNYLGSEPGVLFTATLINSTNLNLNTNLDCIAIRYQNNSHTAPGNTGTGLISLTVKYQT